MFVEDMLSKIRTIWEKAKSIVQRTWKWILGILGVGAIVGVTFLGGQSTPAKVSETVCQSNDGTGARFFAEVENGVVLRVIVAQPEVLNTGRWGDPRRWVETCYGDKGDRRNYAGVGYTYDKARDAFIPPKPHPNAVLDGVNLRWILPKDSFSNLASQ
jgi:hypothetical protein